MSAARPIKPLNREQQRLLDSAPRHIRRQFHRWKTAVATIEAAPFRQKRRHERIWAKRLFVSASTLVNRRSAWRKLGDIVLLDRTYFPALWAGHSLARVSASLYRRGQLKFQGVTAHYSLTVAVSARGKVSARVQPRKATQ